VWEGKLYLILRSPRPAKSTSFWLLETVQFWCALLALLHPCWVGDPEGTPKGEGGNSPINH